MVYYRGMIGNEFLAAEYLTFVFKDLFFFNIESANDLFVSLGTNCDIDESYYLSKHLTTKHLKGKQSTPATWRENPKTFLLLPSRTVSKWNSVVMD